MHRLKAFLLLLPFFLNSCSLAPTSALEAVSRSQMNASKVASELSAEEKRASEELGRFYADTSYALKYGPELFELNAGGEKGATASRYILAVFKQLIADRKSGRAPGEYTPDWGKQHSVSDSLLLDIAAHFGKIAQGPEAYKIALWLLENEHSPEVGVSLIPLFKRAKGDEAVSLYRRLLAQPDLLPAITCALLNEIGSRPIPELKDVVEPFESHYRKTIREAACTAAKSLAVPVRAYVPEQAFTPWMQGQLQTLSSLLVIERPSHAPFMRLSVQTTTPANGKERKTIDGWLLSEDAYHVRILDVFGRDRTYDHTEVKSAPRSLQAEAEELIAARAVADSLDKQQPQSPDERKRAEAALEVLSVAGAQSAQFEPHYISIPEALVAAWCFNSGDRTTAAKLLFPRLAIMKDDRWLVDILCNDLGSIYQRQMLTAFALERDYAGAIAIAEHLSKPQFDSYKNQRRAKFLAAQLKERSEDFKTLVLPDPESWRAMKAKMSLEEQLKYLAARLRLLTCVQNGKQLDYHDPQSSLPPLPTTGAQGKTLINPYSELLRIVSRVKNIPLLFPYLKDRDCALACTYKGSEFHPDRNVITVNQLIVSLINEAATQTLLDPVKLSSLSSAGARDYLDAIASWCASKGDKTMHELSMESLRSTKDRDQFTQILRQLSAAKEPLVAQVAIERMDEFPEDLGTVAEQIYLLDIPNEVEVASSWLKKYKVSVLPPTEELDMNWNKRVQPAEVRFWAALMLLRRNNDDGEAALNELSSLWSLSENNRPPAFRTHLGFVVEKVLASKNAKASKLTNEIASKLITSPSWYSDDVEVSCRLFLAGCPAALQFFLDALSEDADRYNKRHPSLPTVFTPDSKVAPCDYFVEALQAEGKLSGSSWLPKNFSYSEKEAVEARATKRLQLAKWLSETFSAIQKGQPTGLKLRDSQTISSSVVEQQLP